MLQSVEDRTFQRLLSVASEQDLVDLGIWRTDAEVQSLLLQTDSLALIAREYEQMMTATTQDGNQQASEGDADAAFAEVVSEILHEQSTSNWLEPVSDADKSLLELVSQHRNGSSSASDVQEAFADWSEAEKSHQAQLSTAEQTERVSEIFLLETLMQQGSTGRSCRKWDIKVHFLALLFVFDEACLFLVI